MHGLFHLIYYFLIKHQNVDSTYFIGVIKGDLRDWLVAGHVQPRDSRTVFKIQKTDKILYNTTISPIS
jgi:hypothetical protein